MILKRQWIAAEHFAQELARLSCLAEWEPKALEWSGRVEKQPNQLEAVLQQDPDLFAPARPLRLLFPVAFDCRNPLGLCPPKHEPVVAVVLHPLPFFPSRSSQTGCFRRRLHPVESP